MSFIEYQGRKSLKNKRRKEKTKKPQESEKDPTGKHQQLQNKEKTGPKAKYEKDVCSNA